MAENYIELDTKGTWDYNVCGITNMVASIGNMEAFQRQSFSRGRSFYDIPKYNREGKKEFGSQLIPFTLDGTQF